MSDEESALLLRLARAAGVAKLSLAEKSIAEDVSIDDVEELCELISNEFMMNGIEENFEPNSYGLELEALLDAVNRERLRIS
ncbi:hypothetical protein [Pseudomonas panipatensis]|uniref:hypothetical protein n=1 Tax=Pseudomonas panipatensis TaxID=428992 RepID=UPI0035B021FD